ncbi:Molecular chaperone [Methylophaga thiooxydans]|uniref:Molecular chaperone n=1 Tax=Methylophaga thiooxydans TaxID=392484 RepID=A0A0A0BI25_9GAMM|nr:flagellar hook-length control protein FliK [Methylophaga thiooxydans]KGM07322.1 Molecular chaperone [Methylophaga thiooxydans]
MQINSSQQNSAEVIRDVPARLLASLADGERVQATVIAKLSGQSVKLQVRDSVLQLVSQQPLQPGQKIELQRTVEAGRAVLAIVPAETTLSAERLASLNPSLKPGQQLAVDVIKLLAQNRLLVSPSLITNNGSVATSTPANTQSSLAQALPRQIEVDISALKQSFKPGDKLAIEVMQTQPLTIKLRSDSPTRAEQIQSYQRRLIPQIDRTATPLATLNKSITEPVLPQAIRQEITRLFQGVTDKTALQQPEAIKQTINNSGVFLESFLKTNPRSVTTGQDFKANLLQLAEVLKQQVQQPALNRLVDSPDIMKKLPIEVQSALKQLATTPQDLRQLPAQVQAALASKGQTPMQLLLGLLSSLRSATSSSETSLAPLSLNTTQNQNLSGVQAFINARDGQISQAQNAVRFVEWQMMRDLLREVESATARIQFNQLSMARESDLPNNVNVWLFDLPVKDKQQLEMLQLRLEQHSPDLTVGEEAIWQVQLNLETQNLGPMQVRISLHKQDIKVVILAEREESANVLSQYLDELNQRLQKLDISISHLSCRQGAISPLTTDIQPSQGEHLLDISV